MAIVTIVAAVLAVLFFWLWQRTPKGQYSEAQVAAQVQEALNQAQEEFRSWNAQENAELAQEAQKVLGAAVKSARKDAAKRSKVVVSGQISETFAPFLPGWRWNPKDAHFIGSGIDFLVFDGLTNDTDVSVHLVEIKTGKSRQNKREKAIEAAVEAGRVGYEVIRLAGIK